MRYFLILRGRLFQDKWPTVAKLLCLVVDDLASKTTGIPCAADWRDL